MGSSTAKPVFVITGTSGEGKSTLARELVKRVPELALAVSATTRPQRPGEQDGRDYWFVSEEEFEKRLADGDFLEWVELPWGPGYRSGTLWSEIERIGNGGQAPLLEIETGGALAVRDRIPGAVTIFVTAPSREELESRLRSRATESEGEIEERLDIAERHSSWSRCSTTGSSTTTWSGPSASSRRIVRGALDGAGTIGARDSSSR